MGNVDAPGAVLEVADVQATARALGRLLAVSERYPDLKSDQNFLALDSQLEGTENRGISFFMGQVNGPSAIRDGAAFVFPQPGSNALHRRDTCGVPRGNGRGEERDSEVVNKTSRTFSAVRPASRCRAISTSAVPRDQGKEVIAGYYAAFWGALNLLKREAAKDLDC
jgi:LemA family